jgi:hypothetical protein
MHRAAQSPAGLPATDMVGVAAREPAALPSLLVTRDVNRTGRRTRLHTSPSDSTSRVQCDLCHGAQCVMAFDTASGAAKDTTTPSTSSPAMCSRRALSTDAHIVTVVYVVDVARVV